MDTISKAKRSWNMSRIKGRDTKPEIVVRRLLHGMGFRFRLQGRDLPGRPDIVLPKHRVVVMVSGCFWHRHRGCRYATTPATRRAFWKSKFEENVKRDRRVERMLRRLGWRVITVWECQIGKYDRLGARLRRLIVRRKASKTAS